MCAFTNAKTVSAAIRTVRCANLQVVWDPMATYKYVTDVRKRDPDGPDIIVYGELPSTLTGGGGAGSSL